ncbi:MAG: phosphatase PAP2 family protein [Chloroflexi bacterium]|nr:phosphatase PAP2 family protein [Chloroflexota bacterium]
MAIEVAATSRRLIDAVSRRRAYRDVFEIGLVALAFLLYFLVRGGVVDREDEALRNAIDIIDLERSLGFFWEPELNAAILGSGALVQLFNAVYFWLDFPLIVGIGLWLYFFGHRHEYTIARDAVLASGAIALVVYWLYPVMPPRLLPPELGLGFLDTLDEFSNLSYQAQSTQPFVNPFAAVPSLHYGWAVIVGGVLIWSTRSVWLRALGAMMPVLQLAAIVFTANHYILDAMAGLLAAMGGLLIALALQRWGYAGVQRLLARRGLRSSAGTGSRD